ncbi:hypothetical protein DV515_00007241 [Chloebia gouldiae]|uniref:Uncharacterized protein n=1 Tax=Chloebia gouldiae TaxID=44316 RepID=A0A3L8SIL5_CHLGU|nr:hypothetical protein DV515_00007241 [Chloebia gouldiae]
MVSVLPVSLSCTTFLSLLELKGFLEILHSLRSKAALNLANRKRMVCMDESLLRTEGAKNHHNCTYKGFPGIFVWCGCGKGESSSWMRFSFYTSKKKTDFGDGTFKMGINRGSALSFRKLQP